MDPMIKFFLMKIFNSITGSLIVSSCLIKKTKHKLKIVKIKIIKLEENQSLRSPSSKNISKAIKLVANNNIPI